MKPKKIKLAPVSEEARKDLINVGMKWVAATTAILEGPTPSKNERVKALREVAVLSNRLAKLMEEVG